MSVDEEEVAVVAGAVCHLLMSVYIAINYIYRVKIIFQPNESHYNNSILSTTTMFAMLLPLSSVL